MNDLKRKFKSSVKKSLVKIGVINPFRRPFREIEFETTTFCNRKCEYCPNSKYERKGAENGRFMKQETFEKLVSDLVAMNFKGLMSPHFYGEPLTDPFLVDRVAHIRKNISEGTIKIVNNGDFFSRDKYQKLIEAGVDYFYISKHSEKLSDVFNELYDSLSPEEREKRIKIWDYYNDYRENQSMLNTRGGEIVLKKKNKHPACCYYVTYPVVDTFGNVVLCCNDYHSRHIAGNIMERPLLEIWQDPQNIKLRRRIYKGKFDLPICKNCWV